MSAENTRPGREEGFDVLRGLCIILVIAWHAWMMAGTGKSQDQAAVVVQSFMEATFALRMPALMFAAGYFATIILGKKGVRYFIESKVRTVLYPAVIWTVLMAALLSLNPSETHKLHRFGAEVIQPTTHPWFLQYLAAFFAMTVLLWKMNRRVPFALAMLASIAAIVILGESRFLKMVFFFAAGVLTPAGVSEKINRFGVVTGLALVTAGTVVTVEIAESRYGLVSTAASILMIFGMLILCGRYSQTGPAKVAKIVSRKSLEWYLVHWPLILIFSQAIGKVAPDMHYGARFAANLVMGIIGSWTTLTVIELVKATWLFLLPRSKAVISLAEEPVSLLSR